MGNLQYWKNAKQSAYMSFPYRKFKAIKTISLDDGIDQSIILFSKQGQVAVVISFLNI